jgi:RNA polymerase sigma-70 factor (ECF subfamily)
LENEAEVAALYRQHMGAARALALAVTADPALADDIAQDAFIRSASRLSGLRDTGKFRAYLLRAVAHSSVSHFRRRGAERRSLDRLAAERPIPPEVTPRGLAADLVKALAALPPRQRTAVAARFLFDWSEAQTARAMGCRVGTVKSLTSRGLVTLRMALADKEDIDHV